MTANQQTVEQRLAEFTEIHGTVLLGMHRELQSQLKRVDDRLSAAAQSLDAEVERSRKDLQERGQQIDARFKEIADELELAAVTSRGRDADLRHAMVVHSDRMEDLVRKAGEVAEGAQRAASDLVEQARSETGSLVKGAKDAIDQYQQLAVEAFKDSHSTFIRQIEAAEAKITAYMVKQQQLLDQQAQQIESLHASVQQVLAETNAKIELHHRRETEFNRRLRAAIVGLVVVALIAAVVGVWKPWTS